MWFHVEIKFSFFEPPYKTTIMAANRRRKKVVNAERKRKRETERERERERERDRETERRRDREIEKNMLHRVPIREVTILSTSRLIGSIFHIFKKSS